MRTILLIITLALSLDSKAQEVANLETLEEYLQLEFSESECEGDFLLGTPSIDFQETKDKILITVTTGMNGSAKSQNSKIRFYKKSVSVSIETVYPEEQMSLCICKKTLTLEFNKIGSPLEKVFYIQDLAVNAEYSVVREQ